MKDKLYLFSEERITPKVLNAMGLTASKASERPYEKFQLLDTFDLALNSAGIVLTESGGRLKMSGAVCATAALPDAPYPLSADNLITSPLKKALTDVAGNRPLLAKMPVALAVRAFTVTDEEGNSIRVTERRSANSKAGYLYECTGAGDTITNKLSAVYAQSSPAEYLMGFFVAGGHGALYRNTWASIDRSEKVRNIMLALLTQLTDRLRILAEYMAISGEAPLVHAFRVNLRALRALVFTGPPLYPSSALAQAKADFRAMAALTSPVRDCDVAHADLSGKADSTIMMPLVNTRQAAYTDWAKYISSGALKTSLEAWQGVLNDGSSVLYPSFDYFTGLRFKTINNLLNKRLSACDRKRSHKRLHSLRKALKVYRYHIEHLLPNTHEHKKEYIKIFKKIQDDLGGINDRAQQEALIAALLGRELTKAEAKRMLPQTTGDKQIRGALKLAKQIAKPGFITP